MEEIVYDKEGKLKSNALSTYKVPDIYSVPKEIAIHFLETEKENLAIFRSKAVGEPPLMLAISVREAIREAVGAFGHGPASGTFASPATPERVFFAVAQARAVRAALR